MVTKMKGERKMKKILLPLIAVLACMVSCQKDMSVLRISAEQFNGDKVHIDGNYACWDNGDEICFNGSRKTVTVDGTSKYAEIELNSTERSQTTFSAVYPYRAPQNGDYGVEFAQNQTYELVGGNQKIVAPMAAYMDASESDELEFHNLGALLAVEVKADNGADVTVRSITVEAASGVMLNGYASFDPSIVPSIIENGIKSGIGSGVTVDPGTNKVTLNCGNGVTVGNGSSETFYISIPEATTSYLKITISDGTNTYFRETGASHASFNFECNKLYNIEVKMSETEQEAANTTTIIYTTTDGTDVIDEYGLESIWTGAGWTIFSHEPGKIVIDGVLTEIPYQAFVGANITSVIIPEGVTKIVRESFTYCTDLVYVDLPSTLTEVNESAFSDEYGSYYPLGDVGGIVICRSVLPPNLDGDYVFPGNYNNSGSLYVPDESVDAYKDHEAWSHFFNVNSIHPLSEL